MPETNEKPRGPRAQWLAATPAQKLASLAMLLAAFAIIVYVIIPRVTDIVNAARRAP